MQFDKYRQRIAAPAGDGISHYHLPIGKDGTAKHHAQLAPMSMSAHEHEAIQISIPLGNPAVSTVFHSSGGNAGTRTLLPGQCYVVPPGQPHSFAADRSGELVNLYLSPGFLDSNVQDFFLDASRRLRDLTVRYDSVLRFHALYLRNNLKRTRSCEKIQVEATAIAVADHLAANYCDSCASFARNASRQLRTNALSAVLERIESRYTQDLSIGELAEVAGYSSVHFRRLFYNSTGYGPLAYIYRKRIQRAQALLRRTNLPVQEVSVLTGFSTSAHFICQFRKKVGTTPLGYRREFRFRTASSAPSESLAADRPALRYPV